MVLFYSRWRNELRAMCIFQAGADPKVRRVHFKPKAYACFEYALLQPVPADNKGGEIKMNCNHEILLFNAYHNSIDCPYCRIEILEGAIDWVLNDAKYKAPEQVTPECRRWVDRLHAVKSK